MPSEADIAHLLRRAGFGGTAAQITALAAQPLDQTVDQLLDMSGADPDTQPGFLTDDGTSSAACPAAAGGCGHADDRAVETDVALHAGREPVRGGLPAPARTLRRTKSGHGYWILAADGTVRAFGDATNYGSARAPGAVALLPAHS